MSTMSTGTVKWFNNNKGYGFITPDGGSGDVFVHVSAVKNAKLNTLNEGDRLEYELENTGGKTSAINLRLIS